MSLTLVGTPAPSFYAAVLDHAIKTHRVSTHELI